jgi:hypothetical protein
MSIATPDIGVMSESSALVLHARARGARVPNN